MTIEQRTAGLLELVEATRRRQCDAIRDAAQESAAALLVDTRRAAHQRVRDAFVDERAHAAARIDAAMASLQTARRLARQRKSHALLEFAWRELPSALVARWRDVGARGAWVKHATAEAMRLLPRGEWRIDHAPGWPEDERDGLARALNEHGVVVRFAEDAQLAAGLRIRAGGNSIDSTTRGLLADRNAIGAALLASLEDER